MQKLLLFSAMLLLLGACSQNEKTAAVKEYALPTYLLSTGNTTAIADVSAHFSNLRIIPLSEQVANEIGIIFHFQVIDSSKVILVDENSGKISAIDFSGNLHWQISSQSDDYRYFSKIDDCTFNELSQELIVHDGRQMYRYDFEGNFKGKNAPPSIDYHQMVFVASKEMIYSTQGYINNNASDRPKQLVVVRDGQILSTYLEMLFDAPDNVYVGGFPEFSLLNGQLLYHPTFRDTFYSVKLPLVKPAFTFEFEGRTTTEDLMVDKNIKNKLKYVRQHDIPFLYNLAADSNMMLITYQRNRDLYAAKINRATGEPYFNAKYLSYNGVTFQAPLLYNNGFLLWSYPEYEVELAKEIPAGSTELPAGWAEKLQKAKDADLDLGRKYLYLLEV